MASNGRGGPVDGPGIRLTTASPHIADLVERLDQARDCPPDLVDEASHMLLTVDERLVRAEARLRFLESEAQTLRAEKERVLSSLRAQTAKNMVCRKRLANEKEHTRRLELAITADLTFHQGGKWYASTSYMEDVTRFVQYVLERKEGET